MIVRRYAERYVASRGGEVTVPEAKMLKHLGACRTPALGGRAVKCRDCGATRFFTCNSCRDRHCPACGGAARAKWLADRQQDLLPVTYFHLVFTLPDTLRDLALYNKSVVCCCTPCPRGLYGSATMASGRTATARNCCNDAGS